MPAPARKRGAARYKKTRARPRRVEPEIEARIRGIAAANAAEHGGRTTEKVVLAKALGAVAELRPRAREIGPDIARIVSEVNAMSPERQRAEGGEKKAKARAGRGFLPPLEGATDGVVTRFPPEPSGYPHIGHAKAAIINDGYARMYGGRMILRMDDTNPEAERLEYYAAIKVGLEWLGIKPDAVKNTSDDIETIHEKCAQLIEAGRAYVCTCKRDKVSRDRAEGRNCKCRARAREDAMERWDRMFGRFKPGEAAVRFAGDMSSENTAMRDPAIMRVVEAQHPLLGDRHRVWPGYDLAVAVEDSLDGVTHALRSKEYELRDELYRTILGALGMRAPRIGAFSRLAFSDMPVSKRLIGPLVESGKIPWYDDPRLPTIEGMRRRGVAPGAVREFVESLGFTKSDTHAPFEALEAFNRRAIDGKSARLQAVFEAREARVEGLPPSLEVQNHPGGGMGRREVALSEEVLLEKSECAGLEPGARARLMGLGDVEVTGAGRALEARYLGGQEPDIPKLRWVPARGAVQLKIIVPGPLFEGGQYSEESLSERSAWTEPHYRQMADGDHIQFVRYGYCRKDSQMQAVFTHK